MIESVLSSAPGIYVFGLQDRNYDTGGGPVSVAGIACMANRGRPGVIHKLIKSGNWRDILGPAIHRKEGVSAYGIRAINDAIPHCDYIEWVRVLAADAKYPHFSVLRAVDNGAWVTATAYVIGDVVTITGDAKLICITAHTSDATEPTAASAEWSAYTSPVEAGSETYDTQVTAGTGYFGVIYMYDGDPGTTRKVRISGLDDVNERFTLTLYDKNAAGEYYILESHECSINPAGKDDLGNSSYVEEVLEVAGSRIRADWNEALVTWADFKATFTLWAGVAEYVEVVFTGGTNGGTPTTEEWKAAWDTFKSPTSAANMLMDCSLDGEVIANAKLIAEANRQRLYFDIPGTVAHAATITWLKAVGIESSHLSAYYCPFKADDPFGDGKAYWGACGAAVAAKAKGNANFSGSTPGIHYAPAGPERARLERTGIVPLFPSDAIIKTDLVDARINPVLADTANGGATIEDCLSLNYKKNYSRFSHVIDIDDYIAHRFVEGARYAQFEPDGITEEVLGKVIKDILDDLVTSGALVDNRDSEKAGTTEPYAFKVEQVEFDYWQVTYWYCPTGVARRIAGKPILFK